MIFLILTSLGISAPPSIPIPSTPIKGAVNQSVSLFLNWNAVASASTYRVQISTDQFFSSSVVDDSTIVNIDGQLIQNIQIVGLTNNTKYYWRVAAKNVDGWSSFSATSDFTTIIGAPTSPTLSAPLDGSTNQPTSLSLSWSAVTSATTYHIQVSLDPQFLNTVLDTSLSATSRIISNLSNSTTYYWRVQAVNIGGNSSYSSARYFSTVISTPVVIAPINNAINQPVSVTLLWKAVPFAEAYHLQVAADSSFLSFLLFDTDVPHIFAQDTQTVVVEGLTNSTKYYWRLNSKIGTSVSSYSSRYLFTTITAAPGIPALISPLNASVLQPTSITFSWNAAANASTYRLQVAGDAGFTNLIFNDSTLNSATTSKQITTLANNKQYFWRVNSKNVAGTSEFSSPWTVKTIVAVPSIISPINAAINQPTAGTVRWNPVAGAQLYHVQIATSSAFTSLIVNDSTLSDTTSLFNGLSYKTNYYWRVRASNSDGWGNFSTAALFTTIVASPSEPVLQIPLDGAISQSINPTLGWTLVPGATNYRLQVSVDSLFSTTVVNDSTITVASKAIGPLLNFQKYFWRVSSKNIGGTSAFSSTRSFTTVIETPKTLLPLLNAVNQTLPVQIKWSFSAGSIQQRLQISPSTLFDVLVYDDSTLTDTSATPIDLLSNTKYYWRVAARSIHGWSAFSAASNFTSSTTVPVVPTPLLPISGSINVSVPVSLSWLASYGATNYKLQISTDSLFSTIVANDTTLTTTTKNISGLLNAAKYYWRIAAKNSAGSSQYSAFFAFGTGVSTPLQYVPAMNSLNQSTSPILKWGFSQGATHFHLQVSTSSLFNSYVVNDSTLTDTITTVSGLTNITKYYWRIASRYANGSSPFSAVSNFTTVDPPPVSPILSLPVNGATNLLQSNTFSWQASVSATSYRLQISTDSLFSVVLFDDSTLSSTSKLVGPLPPNLTYYWRVSAKNLGGSGLFSLFRSFSLAQGIPIAPVLLTPPNNSTMQQQTTVVGWQASPGAVTYRLQVSTDTLFASLIYADSNITVPSVPINSLLNNTTYYWRANAKNSKGTSANSTVWKFTTSMSSPTHHQPLNGAVSQPVSAQLNWNTSSGAIKYHIQLSNDSNFTQTVINDSLYPFTSIQCYGLQNNTVYYWRVKAISLYNQSAFSNPWKFTTIVTAPEIPLLTLPLSGSHDNPIQMVLRWKGAVSASEYHLQISTDSPFKTLVYNDSTILDTSRFVTGLHYNTTYYWRVRSKNINGSNGFSEVWSFSTIIDLPEVPVLVSPLSASTNQPLLPLLRWNIVDKATRYHLQVSTDSPFKTVVYEDSTIADTSRQIVGLKNDTRYYWRIQALNAAGKSLYSDVWNFSTTIEAPNTPTLVSPLSASVHLSINTTVQWKPIANATTYRLQVATDSPFDDKIFDDSTITDTLFQLQNLNYNTRYYWRVCAKNNGGNSIFSSVWNFTTAMPSPEIPMLCSPVSASNNQPTKILLCWNSSPGSTIYHVQLALDSPFGTTVFEDSIHADTSVTIPNLKNETKYFWRVRGKNSSGYSTYSTIWSFTTAMMQPSVPLLVSPMNAAGNEATSLVLKWNSSVHAQSYHVQVSDDSPFKTIVFEDSTLTDTTMAVSPLRIATRYYWRVRSINISGSSSFSEVWNFKTATSLGVQRNNEGIPTSFALNQNFPNPFNPSTTISFAVAEQSAVTITIYDIMGRSAGTIVDETLQAGFYNIQWRAEYLSAGIYFYRIVAQKADRQKPFVQIKKMVLLK